MAELFCLFYRSVVSFNHYNHPWEVGTVIIIPIFAKRETEAQGWGVLMVQYIMAASKWKRVAKEKHHHP